LAVSGPASPMRMNLDEMGWVNAALRVPSPNCDARPAGQRIELLVIHSISLPPREFGGTAITRLFTNTLDPREHPYYVGLAGLKVSAHFLIRRDGQLFQFVPCALRAWHAGASSWNGRERCNDYSVGIEFEGCDDMPFEDRQYAVCRELVQVLRQTYPLQATVGHSDIAPGRKTDPGPFFDWSRIP
jgi:AmpD protein